MSTIIVTGARAPVALELVRALGRAGHTVYAADSLAPTLAGSSRFCAGFLPLPPPRTHPDAFITTLETAVKRLRPALIIPTCEEVFYLARGHARLAAHTRLFCEPLAILAHWHHKGHFQQAAARLGLRTPQTVLLHSIAELHAALPAFPHYLLKPAFSRFATRIITNCGPYAGKRPLASCRPTPADPWLLQSYIDGETVCSYSLIHAGHVTAHCAYRTPTTAGQGAGTSFVSIAGDASLEVVRSLTADGYSGQIALDFIRTPEGQLYLLECNPRTTSGVHLIAPAHLVTALLEPEAPTWVEPAGRRGQIALATLPLVVGHTMRHPLQRQSWHMLAQVLATPDVLFQRADPLPALVQLPQSLRLLLRGWRLGLGALAATTADIEWNGDADLHA